jgi:hypothetical protein
VVAGFIDDPAHWRRRAEEIRALAGDIRDSESRATMLNLAEDYEQLARRAEERPSQAQSR